MTDELADGLRELASEDRKFHLSNNLGLPHTVCSGDRALFICSSPRSARSIVVTEPSQGQNLVQSCYTFRSFGIHSFRYLDSDGGDDQGPHAPSRVMCETPVYMYAKSINHLFDEGGARAAGTTSSKTACWSCSWRQTRISGPLQPGWTRRLRRLSLAEARWSKW